MPAGGLACLLAALAVTGCGGAQAPSNAQQVTQALRSYLRAQTNGDVGSACALLTDAAQQQLIAAVAHAAKGALPARRRVRTRSVSSERWPAPRSCAR